MRQVFKVTERPGRNNNGTNKVINGRRVIKESLERNKVKYVKKYSFSTVSCAIVTTTKIIWGTAVNAMNE